MDIEYKMLPKATLQEFADSHGFSMLVTESLDHGTRVYRAHFKENVVLGRTPGPHAARYGRQAVCGFGDSPIRAIQDYAEKISDKELIHLRYADSVLPFETYIRSPLLTYNPETNCQPNHTATDTFVDWSGI